MASEPDAGALPKRAMRICGASLSKRPGPIGIARWLGPTLRKRQASVSPEVKEIAWKAQHRLHARYRALTARGKCKQQAMTAIGRELLGFIWAIGVHVESKIDRTKRVVA